VEKEAKRNVLRLPSGFRMGQAPSGQLQLVSENYMGLRGKTRKETSRKWQLPSALLRQVPQVPG
jgi:hypothetical protein